MTKLVVLEDGVVRQLLLRPDVVSEFPFMRAASEKITVKKKKSCNCGNKNRSNISDYSGIRAAIAGMPNDKKIRLKQLLGTEQIRLTYMNVNRQLVKMTF